MTTIPESADRQCPFHARDDIDERARCFDMFGPEYQRDPAESLKDFRAEKPIFFSEKMNYWIVTRYEDIKTIFRDPVLFSARNALEKFTDTSKEANDILASYNYAMNKTLVNEDEPIHMERRRELLDAFAAPNLEALRDTTRALVTEHTDRFIHKGRVDLVSTILWEVPIVIALKFLGVSDDDIASLQRFGVAHKVNTWGRPDPAEQIHVATMVGKFWHYSGQVLERMKANTGDQKGWMYDMIRKNRSNPRVVTDNYLHSMMMAILVAAHETTATATANAIRHLLSRPNLWKKLHDQPHMIPAAVEECLRFSGPIVAWRREATQDTEISGVKIARGDKLFLVMASANRDADHFENPDMLDIQRDNASEHLSFGYGAHQCLGRNIGRLEMCVIIEELTRRIPYLELEKQEFTNLPNTSFHGPESLWVRWNPNTVNRADREPTVFPIGNPDKKAIYRNTRVVMIRDVAWGIKEITLETADPELPLPAWSPGAHIELILPNGLERKYSLCPARSADQYVIAIKREQDSAGGSKWLHDHLAPGMEIKIRGPKSFFRLDPAARNCLLIAGGIGITPILSMAARLAREGRNYSLIYCGRQRDSMAYLDKVQQLHDQAQIHISTETGRADFDAILKQLPRGSHIYACGPETMLDALERLAGVYQLGLSFELFSSSSSVLNPELEEPFNVELVDTGKTYRVPRDQTLLQVLLENGVDVPNDCEEGLCGSCEVVVLDGNVEHRDKVLTASERAAGNRMMTCCSRGKGTLKIKL